MYSWRIDNDGLPSTKSRSRCGGRAPAWRRAPSTLYFLPATRPISIRVTDPNPAPVQGALRDLMRDWPRDWRGDAYARRVAARAQCQPGHARNRNRPTPLRQPRASRRPSSVEHGKAGRSTSERSEQRCSARALCCRPPCLLMPHCDLAPLHRQCTPPRAPPRPSTPQKVSPEPLIVCWPRTRHRTSWLNECCADARAVATAEGRSALRELEHF